jgi:predicted small lipoprotein YifL
MKRGWLPVMLAIALAAGGCGQKGPLYLPDKNAKVATAPATGTAPASPAVEQPAPATAQPATPAEAPAAPAAPQTQPAPKPTDKDQDPQPPPK